MGSGLIIGRTADCGVTIEDSAASRRHVEIRPRGASFHWKDLGSTNGTYVNGARMLAGELKTDDVIRIGESSLRFKVEEAPDEAPAAQGADAPANHTIFRETYLDATGEISTGRQHGKTADLLQAIYEVMNDIATTYEPCALIDRILQTTMRAINAQRGALFLADARGQLLPCTSCHKVHTIHNGVLEGRDIDEMRISQTVASRVLENGESVLYQDTDTNGAIETSESIVSLKLRSIVCVPLRAKNGIMGILYIDSDRPNQSYTEDDVLLATSVGSSAGLALENAQMHQQILEKQRIEQEIGTAWSIQEGFLVKDWPKDARFEVFGQTRPAKTVGGDFYDFVHTTSDRVGILIGDVSGKGVPAALTMAQLLAEFRLRAREFESPAAVLEALNRDLSERAQRGMFCTLCYLVLELPTGQYRSANAGHLPCLHTGREGAAFICEASGPPVGIVPMAQWQDEAGVLAPGDSVLLYTDGIIEARKMSTQIATENGQGLAPAEYGQDAVAQVAAAHANAPPRMLIDAIIADVHGFTQPLPPHDDCTMIALRYDGHA